MSPSLIRESPAKTTLKRYFLEWQYVGRPLVEMLDDRSGLLNAEWITVESVHNPWLAKKLDFLGFSRFELSEHSPPSFYCKLRK
jgi:hypothetical protein